MSLGRNRLLRVSATGLVSLALAGLVLACVSLPVAAQAPSLDDPVFLDVRALLIIGIAGGVFGFLIAAALLFLRAERKARAARARARAEAGEVRRIRETLQAVLDAEPQIVLSWGEGGDWTLVVDTLEGGLGVPHGAEAIMDAESWLEPEDAGDLSASVAHLRETGAPFNLMLKTRAGAHIEVDGRAAGGSGVLKIRDLAGRRAELASLGDRHGAYAREIETLRTLLDALPVPVWLRGPDQRLTWVNAAYAHAVEAPDRDTAVTSGAELLEPENRAAAAAALEQGSSFRKRLQTMIAGVNVAYDAVVVPAAGASAGAALMAEPPPRAEANLSRLGSAHARTLDRIATAVAIFDNAQRMTYFNQAFADLWGLDPAWLASRPRHGELLDRLREQFKLEEQRNYRDWRARQLEIYAEGKPAEDWWHLPDGRAVHLVAEVASDGGLTCLFEDTTEKFQLESRVNSMMHVQRETLDNLREGVAVFATDGRLRLFNPSFAGIWRLPPAMLAGEPHLEEVINQCRVLFEDEAEWDKVRSSVTSLDDHREPIEGQLARPDGSTVDYAGLPLPDGATLLTYVDITDSKRVERALIDRNEALEKADQLKSTFISHVSYELRTPLQSIIGFSELLSTPALGDLNAKQREYLGDIHAESQMLHAIINDILDLATIDAGAMELKLARVNARDVVEGATLAVRERLERDRLTLDARLDPRAGAFMADGTRVTQVLYNLLSNAINFSETGGTITLTTALEGDTVAFTVEDRGCGIPEELQSTVFGRFETAANGTRRHGAGLGLAIVDSLVKIHGGSRALHSVPGKGTRVTVRFPRAVTGTPEAEPIAPARSIPAE